MSYILSALKKAEQERHSGDAPDVLTPQTIEVETSSRRVPKLYFAGGVAVALLAGLWMADVLRFNVAGDAGDESLAPPPSAAPGVSSDGAMQAETDVSPALFSPAPSAGLAGDEPVFGGKPDEEFGADTDAAGTVPKWAREWPVGDSIPDMAELPPSLRKNMPRLELTGHLYSLGHPNARKVILNGVALKEGQYLDDDLLVSEITPDGVILDFHGRLFRIGAAQMFR